MWPIKSKKRFEYCSGFTVEISAPAWAVLKERNMTQLLVSIWLNIKLIILKSVQLLLLKHNSECLGFGQCV